MCVIVTYLNWLLVICVLNFPRVSITVFKHWCDVYTSKFKYLTPVRAHSQGGRVFF